MNIRQRRNRLIWIAVLLALVAATAYGQASLVFHTVTVRRSRPGFWKVSTAYPQFANDLPIELLANQTLKAAAEKQMREFVKQCTDEFRRLGKPRAPYEQMEKSTVALARPTLISAYVTGFTYTGGAHGNIYYPTYNFGFIDGKPRRLALRDLFRPGEKAVDAASELVMEKLKANPRATFVKDGSVKSIGPDLASAFVVSPTGITFLLPPYAVAPYSEGSFFVKVPFAEFGDKLNPNGPLKGLMNVF
jgi:hypothetical protein